MIPSELAEEVRKYVDAHIGRDSKVTVDYHIIREALEFRIVTYIDAIKEAGSQKLKFQYFYPLWDMADHNHLQYRENNFSPETWDDQAIIDEVSLMARRAFMWRYVFYNRDKDELWITINGEQE